MIFNYLQEAKPQKKKFNIKVLLIILCIVLIVGLIASVVYLYFFNAEFQLFVDKKIFKKEITEGTLPFVLLNTDNNQVITAYNRYIAIIEKGKIMGYTSSGRKSFEIETTINSPLVETGTGFLVIAEKKGQKLYYISGTNVTWEKEIEGEILSIHANKNGYVSIIIQNMNYRSIVITYDNKGNELFRNVQAKTYIVDADVSNDNKYLAIAELNTNGSIIQSNIKVISIEKASKNEQGSFVYINNNKEGDLIISLNFQDKNALTAMYDNKIDIISIESNTCETFTKLEQNDTLFADINLEGTIVRVRKVSNNIFSATSEVILTNTNTKKENIYTIEGMPKNVYTQGDLIAIDIGSEIHFINTSGWLIKKYIGSRESKGVVLGGNAGGIIHRNKVELINL